MRNILKRKLLGSLLAAAMAVSCFSALLAVPATAQAEEREATYFEGFEDMDGYTYTSSQTIVRAYKGSATIDGETYHSGKGSVKLVPNTNATSKVMIRVRTGNGQLQLANGNRYHMSFYYKSNSTSSWNLCYAVGLFKSDGLNDANVSDWSSYSVLEKYNNSYPRAIGAKADGWQRVDLVFTVSNATDTNKYLLLYVQPKNNATCYIDDISVTKIDNDDNAVIVNTPAGEKAVYGQTGNDYSALIDRKYNNQYLAGVYSDSSYSTKVSSTVFGDETTPVTSNIPTTVYAKYADRTEYDISFDDYADDYSIDRKYWAANQSSIELSTDKANSKAKSLKFTATTKNAKANVRLDMKTAKDIKLNVGTNYVVSFKYFIDNANNSEFYYNFALAPSTSVTNSQIGYGWQMINSTKPGGDGNYYWSSRKIEGKDADGWQTATVQFTARKGNDNPDILFMNLQGNTINSDLYIDDIKITELFDNEYAVIKNENNGNEPTVQIGYEGDSLSLETPVYEGSEFDGWYTDSALTTELTATKFGADETPVTSYVPFTAYAKWKVRTFAKFDFDNYAEGYSPSHYESGNSNSRAKMEFALTDEKSYVEGGKALKFQAAEYSDPTTPKVSAANVRLDMKTANDASVTNGDTYLITFKYFVGSNSSMEWYYNFAVRSDASSNLNSNTEKSMGMQMLGNPNDNGQTYGSSKPLSGTSDDGWQTAVCQFTADTTAANGNKLFLYVQGNKVSANVPLYIDDIVVTKLYDGEYAAQIIKNNGEEKVVCYGSEGEVLPLETPVRAHYDFTGWYTDSDCTTKFGATTFGSGSTPLVNNIPFAIYAGWEEATNYIKIDDGIQNGSLTVDYEKEIINVNANNGYQLVPGSLKFKFNYGGKDYIKPVTDPVANDENAYSFAVLLNDEVRVGTIVVTAKFAKKQDIAGAAVASALRKANATQTEGIRFLNRFYASEATLKAASFGAIVTPYDNIEALGITKVTLDNLNEVKGENITANKFCNTNTTYRDYAIVITDVKDKNREFAVIPYMTYDNITVYGTMEVRSYNDAAEYSNIGCEIYDSSVLGNAKSLDCGLRLNFSDDFNGDAINNEHFKTNTDNSKNSADRVSVGGGKASLSITGSDYNSAMSGNLTSYWRYTFSADSYVELRAKLPMQEGRSNSFWAKSVKKDGILIEYDMFETFGSTNTIQANIHIWDENKKGTDQFHYSLDLTSQSAGNYVEANRRQHTIDSSSYHTFGIRRTKNAITFYCDGEAYFTYDLNKLFENYGVPESYRKYFDQDAYMIIGDGALKTATAEQVSAMTKVTYDVDYVKGYYNFGSRYAAA